jgi:hypothetical protein
MQDQQYSATWSNIGIEDLSRFIHSDDVIETRRWVMALSDEALLKANFHGTDLFPLCLESFRNRFSIAAPDTKNVLHLHALRRLLVSTARMYLASNRFFQVVRPDLVLIAGGTDFITATLRQSAKELDRDIVLFQWQLSQRGVQINYSKQKEGLLCELMLQGLVGIRSDCRTWSSDLTDILDQILEYLDIPTRQMQLPLAR